MLYSYARLRLAGLRAGIGASARVTVVAAGPNLAEDGTFGLQLSAEEVAHLTRASAASQCHARPGPKLSCFTALAGPGGSCAVSLRLG
jgi:hypothetical protein